MSRLCEPLSLLFRLLTPVIRPFVLSPKQGAATPVYVATAPELDAVSGRFFMKQAEAKTTPASYDEALSKRLWEVSAQLTGLLR